MSEKKTSQAQQSANPFETLAADQMARFTALSEQMASYEREGAERAQKAVDEMARLTKESIAHTLKLTEEWRKLSMETMQRSAEMAQGFRVRD
jgi:hypothetical protein